MTLFCSAQPYDPRSRVNRMTSINAAVHHAKASHSDEPDAHGQAALLLAEAMLHAMVAKSLMTNQEAIEIVGSAAEIKVEVATAAGESSKRMNQSLALLSRMTTSLVSDERG